VQQLWGPGSSPHSVSFPFFSGSAFHGPQSLGGETEAGEGKSCVTHVPGLEPSSPRPCLDSLSSQVNKAVVGDSTAWPLICMGNGHILVWWKLGRLQREGYRQWQLVMVSTLGQC
jgi:hypothetical protein